MRVLTLNSGSSSVKFSLIETSKAIIAREADRFLARGSVERISTSSSVVRAEAAGAPAVREVAATADHKEAIRLALSALEKVAPGAAPDAVGHRVVHGGPDLSRSCLIDADVEREIEEAIDLAPLHNPHNLAGIRAARELIPEAAQVAAFDTGFHRTIPPHVAAYALPQDLCRKHGLRRYGFHGLSHRYVTYRIERLLKRPRTELRLISIHLGNGCSLTAVEGGTSVETSMGFTPAEGLIMGTRPGDVDAGALLHLMIKEGMAPGEVETLVQRRSGLMGLSGVSNDMREVLAARSKGNEQAALAVDAFVHRLRKYIGAYMAVLGKVDAIGFTGGIGENMPEVRARALDHLAPWGIHLDAGANEETIGREGRISTDDSRISVFVIPANEELVIARDTVRCVEDARLARFDEPSSVAPASR